MKKLLALILMALSLVMCCTGCSSITNKDNETTSSGLLWEETLLDDWYIEGDDIAFRVLLNSKYDVYEKITYSISNSKETEVSVITGKVSNEKQDLGGKYYVDTGAEIIQSEDLGVGAYVVLFYAYDKDGERIQINDEPIVFQIKEAKQ